MKKKVYKLLGATIIIVMLLSLVLNHCIQLYISRKNMEKESKELFWQIEQILNQNQTELQDITDDFAASCLTKARATAYMIQSSPLALQSEEEIKKISQLLQIDEFHIIDEKGLLYAGSEPKYFGLTLNSGEQINYFLPMLGDKSLELCQKITPNTAEGKLMQYAAVWTEDGKNIVQIGMEPQRVINATKRNELSYIFSLLTADKGMVLYAADPKTYEILGSTDTSLVGKSLSDIGFNTGLIGEDRFKAEINGKSSYAIFEKSEKSVMLGRSVTTSTINRSVYTDSTFLLIYLIIISAFLIFTITNYLDKRIIRGINNINKKLQSITDGNLDEQVNVNATSEFTELSGHINLMVKSILESTDMLSSLLDITEISIGVYEYNNRCQRLRVTNCVWDILEINSSKKDKILSNTVLFKELLQEIMQFPYDQKRHIYRLNNNRKRYVKIETFKQGNNVIGILIDMTQDIREHYEITKERDEDLLTGLLNRRGYYAKLESLFSNPDDLNRCAIVMIDSDNLKTVNDTYGHDAGDKYLCAISKALSKIPAPKKIVSRLSGDEFALLIYKCTSYDELHIYLNEIKKLQTNIKVEIDYENILEIPVGFSMGYHICPENEKDYHSLIKIADQMMYENKRQRKQRK
ncbi:MAG: diguanylate cyclase [Clostridiales bacterium]|nr:diguanylate cyclase [Clostridiales bacterium]